MQIWHPLNLLCAFSCTGHRTQHTGAVLLNAIHQQCSWPSLSADRYLSTSIHDQLQQGSSIAAAVGDPIQQCSSANLAMAEAATSTATTNSSSSILGSLSSSSTEAGTSVTQLFDAGTMSSFAAQPLEPFWQVMNPIVMSCSLWEMMHSATGLPWWASIPLTTLALRTALLPLTLKAKSAGLNFVLAQQATQTATNLLDHWKQQAAQQGGSSSALSQRGFGLGGKEALKRPSRWRLSRMYYRYYRKQHGTTSLWWWTANIGVQVGHCVPASEVCVHLFTCDGVTVAWAKGCFVAHRVLCWHGLDS